MSYVIAQNQQGPLPLKIPFDVPISGDVSIAFAGTCWSNADGALCGVLVEIDGQAIGKVPLYINNHSMHMTLQTQFFPFDLSEGDHTVTLSAMTANTVTDANDYFSVWVVEG